MMNNTREHEPAFQLRGQAPRQRGGQLRTREAIDRDRGGNRHATPRTLGWTSLQRLAWSLAVGVCLAIGGIGQGTAWAQIETVVKLDGSRSSGKLLEMGAVEITLERNRNPTKIPVQEIDHIRFADEPLRMNQLREAIQAFQYEQAAKELGGMSWEGLRPDTVLDGIYFSAKVKAELALAGVPGHSITDAVGLLRRFQENGKNHYQYHRAMLLYGQLAFAANRLPLAIETFQSLAGVTDQTVALRASVEMGQAQLLEKQWSQAAQTLQRATQFDLQDPDSLRLKQTARVLGLVASAGDGNVEAAVEGIQGIIAGESPDDVQFNGMAYNAIGRLRMMANQPRDAELAFLHTDLLFAANAQAHPEALFYLVQIWTDSGKTDRASEAREKLKTRYGGTYWGQRLANQ